MQPRFHLRSALLGLIVLLSTLPHGRAVSADVVCDDVAGESLRVLTINLLFSEIENRNTRLARIADFVAPPGEPPRADIIFLQEVVGGQLVRTRSSARDLQRMLQNRSVEFELRSADEFTLPGLFTVGNATLSRCDILFEAVGFLTPQPELEIGGEAIPLPRNVLCTRIDVPGFGRVNACNTHLCAGCTADERGVQLTEALNFLGQVRNFLPGPTIWAGDFNMDRFRDGGIESPQYQSILASDFVDAYADVQTEPLDSLCEEPSVPDEHCTVGVSALDGSNARRIDYVFAGDSNFASVIFGEVVFNPGPGSEGAPVIDPDPDDGPELTVSDHAGVWVGFELPTALVASVRQ